MRRRGPLRPVQCAIAPTPLHFFLVLLLRGILLPAKITLILTPILALARFSKIQSLMTGYHRRNL